MGDAVPLVNGAPGQKSFLIKDAVVSAIDKTVNKVQLELYYAGEDEIPVFLTYKGKRALGTGVTTTLKPGLNLITMDGMKTLSWNSIGTIEYLLIRYDNAGATASDNVYVAGITIYK